MGRTERSQGRIAPTSGRQRRIDCEAIQKKETKLTKLVRLSTLTLPLLVWPLLFCPRLAAAEKPAPAPGASPAAASGPFAALKFRYIGPEGNRVSSVAGIPG